MMHLTIEPIAILRSQRLCSYDDDRDVPTTLIGADLCDEFKPIHLGHHQVEHDRVGDVRLQLLAPGAPILCFRHMVARLLQGAPQEPPGWYVVLDDQNMSRLAIGSALLQGLEQ